MNTNPFSTRPARHSVFSVLAAVLLLSAACMPARPTVMPTTEPLPTESPTSAPAPTNVPRIEVPFAPPEAGVVAPIIVRRLPEAGERLNPTGSIELTFDRPMDQASVAGALKLSPAIKGAITWKDARTLSFTPDAALPRNTVLDVAVTQDAKDDKGAALAQPFIFRLTTQGNLEVAQTIPADKAPEVAPDTIITVLFNRPVVPLTTLGEQSKLPNPLSFTPALEGKAEWLNTSVLVFKPSKALAGGTAYTGAIAPDLKDVDGNPISAGYTWSFTTVAPKVIAVSPLSGEDVNAPGGRRVVQPGEAQPPRARIDTAVTVQFNQPVEAASARAAFSLVSTSGDVVTGESSVLSDTLTFTPAAKLVLNTQYAIRVAPGVTGIGGGVAGADAFASSFTTVPLPEIVGTVPTDNDNNADPYTSFIIQFNTEIKPETIWPRLRFSPAISAASVYSYYNDYEHSFWVNFDARPGQQYEVKIDAGIEDPYGNAIATARTVRFKTRDADPYAELVMPYGGATLNAYLPSQVVVQSTNLDTVDLELYRIDATPESLAAQYYRDDQPLPGTVKQIRKFSQKITAQRNTSKRTLVDLADGVAPLQPGAYLVRLSSVQSQERGFQLALMYVSQLNIVLKTERGQTLAWVTDLKTGAPVADVEIEAFETEQNLRAIARPIGRATTDANGVALMPRPTQIRNEADAYRQFPVMAVARGARFAIGFSNWQNGISPYDFGISLPFYGGESPVRAHVYTDRPLYRAGQTVYARGIVRMQDDFAYTLPQNIKLVLQISDPAGGTTAKDATVDANGTFAFDYAIPAGASLGDYAVALQVVNPDNVQLGSSYFGFKVAAYRPPEFEVTVKPALTETVRGNTLDVDIQTAYLSGGPLANATVRWNVLAQQTSFAPVGFEQYSFADTDNPWRCFDCWWNRGNEAPPQPLLSGAGRTDDKGILRISFPISAEIRNAQGDVISGPVQLSIEANATGSDNQVLAGRAGVVAHPAERYAGIAFEQSVVDAGKPVTAALVAVGLDGQRVPNAQLDAAVFRREWSSKFVPAEGGIGGRWESTVTDELITEQTLSTDGAGEAKFIFTAPKAGSYKVVASGKDASGRAFRSGRFLWVTGRDYVSWIRENNERITLIANKTTFAQGETAEILIPTPFIDAKNSEHYMLVTVERGHIRKHEVVKVTSSSMVYRLLIADDYAPNIFVSAVLMSGPNAPRSEQKLGLLTLRVTPRKQVFSATLTPDRLLTQPGETVTYTLNVKDADGNPVRGSFSVDLVDKGVLNLQPRPTDAIVAAFYGEAGLSVGTASGLTVSANRIADEEQRREADGKGGGPGVAAFDSVAQESAAKADTAPAAAAPLARTANAANAPEAAVRENFADTAYWKADVATDDAGNATIVVALPDNLTTWVMRAVGVDAETRVGEAQVNVVATKPLLIRPVTPRFLVVDDEIGTRRGDQQQHRSAADGDGFVCRQRA